MRLMQRSRLFFTAAAVGFFSLLPLQVAAEDLDIDALLAAIDEKSGQYDRLIEILQGPDATRALAAFDVMLTTNDMTLRETAISAAITATDERLRARALWEMLVRKDSVTLYIETTELANEEIAALDAWIGSISTWPITARHPETQCLNLYRTERCEVAYNMSVSGLQVDIIYKGRLEGRLTLNGEGILVGHATNPNTKVVFPVSIQLR